MRSLLRLVCFSAVTLGLASAGGAELAEPNSETVLIDVGAEDMVGEIGWGWLVKEHDADRTFMWIRHLEGDIWVDLDRDSAAEIEVSANPFYLPNRRQTIGLYVNDHFVTEWNCHNRYEWLFESHVATIPEGVLKQGRNRITLRVGYVSGDRGGDRALAVDYVKLRFE